MKVFLAGTSLRPTYGGPAYSVSRLAAGLCDAGAQVGLWAADQSALNTNLLRADSRLLRLGGTEAEALRQFGGADVIHDNGIWLPYHHRLAGMAASLGIPRLVSMRGMLEPWAMQHKRWKKRMAWHLYQRRDLASAQYHHATSAKESSGVQRLRLGVPVGVIPNGVDLPLRDHHGGLSRAALFLGRLYPVKGLPMLVEAWARVRPQGWTLRIAGPDEAGHRAHLEKSVSAAGLGAEITFLGPLEGAAKSEAFSEAQLFVLPSHSESFGMAVGEALAHGLPVLTTTAVPWPLLPVRGCGWQVAPTVEGIAEGLSGATSLTPAALAAMGANGRELVAAEFGWERVAAQFLRLYGELAAGTASGPMKRQGQE